MRGDESRPIPVCILEVLFYEYQVLQYNLFSSPGTQSEENQYLVLDYLISFVFGAENVVKCLFPVFKETKTIPYQQHEQHRSRARSNITYHTIFTSLHIISHIIITVRSPVYISHNNVLNLFAKYSSK